MAATMEQIKGFLEGHAVKYIEHSDTEIVFGSRTDTYRSPEGEDGIRLIAGLTEEGRYFYVFAPRALIADGDHVAELLQVCMEIQWRTKLIQFEYDSKDGEIRPIVEFPLEDSELTAAQFHRCVSGMIGIMEEFFPIMQHAKETGETDFRPSEKSVNHVLEALQQMADGGQLTNEQIAMLKELSDAASPCDEPPDEL